MSVNENDMSIQQMSIGVFTSPHITNITLKK